MNRIDTLLATMTLEEKIGDYTVDGALFLKQHYEGGYLYRNLIILEAFPDAAAPAGWLVKYGYQDKTPNLADTPAPTHKLPDGSGIGFELPIVQTNRPGIRAKLRFEARNWNDW